MQRLIVIAIAIALVFVAGTAQAEKLETSLDVGVGYRTDKVDWNLSGNLPVSGGFVNPLLEDELKDLVSIYSKANIRMSYKKFHVRGSLGYGRLVDGRLHETDWAVSGRQSEFARAIAAIDGYVFDTSIGFGYHLVSGEFTAIPLIGYSWHLQYFEISDVTSTLCVAPECTIGTGPVPFSNLTIEPRWQGPWVGLDISLQPSDEARLFATVEYHFGDYKSDATWALQNLGFDQIADAEGFVIGAGFTYTIKDSLDIGIESQYSQWKSDAGTHGFVGNFIILNEANWESLYVMLNITHRFYQLNDNKRLSSL
jgi:hypothetical protein